MKTTILLLAVMLSGIMSANAQKKTEYKASNGIVYHVGDTIQLGRGSRDDGTFNYLQMGGVYMAMSGEYATGVGKNYSGFNVVIKKIKETRLKGAVRTYFVVGGGNITNYWLMIDDALATGEVVDPTKNKAGEKEESASESSKADKLRELKQLLDEGILTQEEFDAEKKKVLNS